MKLKKRTGWILAAVTVCLAGCLTVSVFASPSIRDIQREQQETTITAASTDGTNTAEVLSECGIYTSGAVVSQYMVVEEDGSLTETPLSTVIDLGSSTVAETDENGTQIPDSIATVSEMIESYCEATNTVVSVATDSDSDTDIDLSSLDQLTYWLDFKYIETDTRVISGETVTYDDQSVALDNGMIEATIDGGELLRAADADDFLIFQINAETGDIYCLKMKDYDAATGKYTVDFPCVGPYMITMIMQ